MGASFFAAQTRATIHPITLHPKKKLSKKIASRSRLLRASAMIDGRKYITNPKPKKGRKRNVEKIGIEKIDVGKTDNVRIDAERIMEASPYFLA
jgi:hypothetical protein